MERPVRVCLVNPELQGPYPPLGLAYVAGYLRQYGQRKYDIKIIDGNCCGDVLSAIRTFNPDIVGYSAFSPQIASAVALCAQVRRWRADVLQIIGGIHVSGHPEPTVRRAGFDLAILGEGEITLMDVVDTWAAHGGLTAETLSNIRGTSFVTPEGKYHQAMPRPQIQNLDTIPFPARDLLNMEHYLNNYLLIRGLIGNRITTIHTSRGCPFDCTFCSSTIVFRGVRHHSTEYAIRELTLLADTYRVKNIFFTDDTFVQSRKRVRALCEAIIDAGLHKRLKWECQARANVIGWQDVELLKLMKEAGCIQIDYGFESGSTRILQLLKQENGTVEVNQRALDITKEAGLHVLGTFMMGIPGETDDDIELTVQFIEKNKHKIDHFQAFVAWPFPGAELYDLCRQRGLVEPDYFDQLEREQRTKGLIIYSDTVSPEKVATSLRYLNALSAAKVHPRHKVEWLFYNTLRHPRRTLKTVWQLVQDRLRPRDAAKMWVGYDSRPWEVARQEVNA